VTLFLESRNDSMKCYTAVTWLP